MTRKAKRERRIVNPVELAGLLGLSDKALRISGVQNGSFGTGNFGRLLIVRTSSQVWCWLSARMRGCVQARLLSYSKPTLEPERQLSNQFRLLDLWLRTQVRRGLNRRS
jgi:hypothetical protein